GRRRDLADSAWIYEPMNEMYDPATDVWTPVSALLQGRANHTATVLNNGKIMITGGYNAANRLRCMAGEDSLEEDCWHITYDPLNTQNGGNQGYLDGAEFFDQNGARVILQEQTYGVTPYRVAQHTAALEPDGRWRMHGGYGNIYPTFFTNSPALTNDSIIDLTLAGPVGSLTATINPTSIIRFPLIFRLSRPVSGRLVDADAFISPPPSSLPISPSIAQDTVKFYIPRATAPVDGSPVGMLLGENYKPGDFDDIVQLQNPQGTAEFLPQQIASGDNPITTVVGSAITMAPLFPEITGSPVGGSVNAQVTLIVPDTYRSIVGVASLLSGGIIDTGDIYSITLNQAGSGTFDTGAAAPVSCDTTAKTCTFAVNINFTGVSGLISNLTTLLPAGTTVYQAAPPPNPALDSSVNTADSDEITLSLELNYIARQVSVLDRAPFYTFTRSTMVIRGMVFSSQLGYSPDSNSWSDLTNIDESPAMATPSFNHTTLLTPAADTAILGGRNCEFKPDADCLRAVMRFSTATVASIGVPVFRGADGGDSWPAGEALKSKRAFHTSTLLPDGSILACGGSDGARPLATCELMDPQTKKWAFTGSMNLPRANHTASLLPNGSVLAAGGITPFGIAVSSAEIYYPLTRRWVPTSSMANARQLHTATLLPDGNVLVAGGATLSTYSAAAEIYISSAAYWTSTVNNMVNGRSQHTATLLKNGNVLMAGGVNGLGAMNQTEIYDYLARTFSAGPDLNTARYAHTANQLRDGNVIVIGGSNGINSGRTCEIYNGTNWTTELAPDLNYNRANHRSVLLPNGKIMLTGGELSGVAQSVPESFDPDYRNWSFQGSATGRTHHTSVLTRDNLLINIGGWSGGNYLASTEYANFNFYPDMNGLEAETTRQAIISSSDRLLFNHGDRITLLSNTSNFHGITEASGGGAGPANSSFHNPRVYIQQIDNPSGFMVDLSTRIYSLYAAAAPNPSWERTLSS
ncbi:MAG: hypothetical protein Q8O90_08680, partial [Elusimicrobiota bacterium]|nr:hypothetical protein [Elusimicrobiota bacterium]